MDLVKFTVLVLITGLLMACGSDAPEQTPANQTTTPPATTSPEMAPQQPSTPQNVNYVSPDGSVHHYICPDFCEGSGSETPGTCPVCSKSLAHNQAWHNQGDQGAQQPQIQMQQSQQDGQRPSSPLFRDQSQAQQPAGSGSQFQNMNQPTPHSELPAQNARGEWHYICSAGCSGGSGMAGVCSQCGAALSHNNAYHQ